jgi:large repetitive protein
MNNYRHFLVFATILLFANNIFAAFQGKVPKGKAIANCPTITTTWTGLCADSGKFIATIHIKGGQKPYSVRLNDGQIAPKTFSSSSPDFDVVWYNTGSSAVTLSLESVTDSNGCTGNTVNLALRVEGFNAPPVTTGNTICGTGFPASFQFLAQGTGVFRWYNTPTGGVPVATGNRYQSPEVKKTTSWYVERENTNVFRLGKPNTDTGGPGSALIYKRPTATDGLAFHVNQRCSLDSFNIIPATPGTFQIRLRNAENTQTLATSTVYTFTTDDTAAINIIRPGFQLMPGNYIIDAVGSTAKVATNVLSNSFYPLGNVYLAIDSSLNGSLQYPIFYRINFTAYSCTGKRGAATLTINGPDAPAVTATGPLSFCPGDSVRLTGPAALHYIWNTGDTTQSIKATQSGKYYLKLKDANGCISMASDTLKVYTGNPFALLPSNWLAARAVNTSQRNKTIWLTNGLGYYQDDRQVLKSTNNGSTWTSVSLPGTNTQITDISFSDSKHGWVTTLDNGIYKTSNSGATWDIISPGFGLSSVVALDSNNVYFGLESGGTYASTDAGTNFTTTNFPSSGSTTQMVFPGANTAYATYTPGAIIKATDLASNTWQEVGMPNSSDQFFSLDLTSPDNGWVVGENATVWHTTDAGNNWTKIDLGVGATTQFTSVKFINSNIGFITGTGNTVLKTTNAGATWIADKQGLNTPTSTWNQVAANSSGYYFIVGNREIAVSAPSVVVNATSSSFCPGDSSILSAPSGFGTYIWNNGATTPTISVKTPGNYTVQVGQGASCILPASAPVVISYKPAPAKPVITASGPLSFCLGDSVTLSTAANGPYLWTNADTASSITIKQTTKIALRVIGGSCSSPLSDSVTITVKPLPLQPTITVTGSANLCPKDSVTLEAPAGYTSYIWSNGARTHKTRISQTANITLKVGYGSCLSPVSTGVAITLKSAAQKPQITHTTPLGFCNGDSVMLSGPSQGPWLWSTGDTTQQIVVKTTKAVALQIPASGILCASPVSDSVKVAVNALPVKPVIQVTGKDTLCNGNSVVLTAPAGFASYSWNHNNATTASITVTKAGKYVVRVQNSQGCTSPVSDTVTIYSDSVATPTISKTGSLYLCRGTAVTLKAGNGTKYLWSNGSTTDSIIVTTPGTYSVQAVGVLGCVGPKSATFELLNDTIPVSQTGFICNGNAVTLRVKNPMVGYSYTWTGGLTGTSIQVSNPGAYRVSTKSLNAGCPSDSSVAEMVVMPFVPGKPVLNISGRTAICATDSLVLVVTGRGKITWNDGFIGSRRVLRNPGTYSVSASDSLSGCKNTLGDTVILSVNPKPVVTASGIITGSICPNDTTIKLTATPGGVMYYITGQPAGQTSNIFRITKTGNYKVVMRSAAGCLSDSSQPLFANFNKPVFPKPILAFDAATRTFTVVNLTRGPFAWYRNNVLLPGQAARTYRTDSAGFFQVYAMGTVDSCNSMRSDSVFINKKPVGTLNLVSADISVYPNPGNQTVIIGMQAGMGLLTTDNLVFTDALGRKFNLPVATHETNSVICETSSLPVGVYYIQVPVADKIIGKRWVKNQ